MAFTVLEVKAHRKGLHQNSNKLEIGLDVFRNLAVLLTILKSHSIH